MRLKINYTSKDYCQMNFGSEGLGFLIDNIASAIIANSNDKPTSYAVQNPRNLLRADNLPRIMIELVESYLDKQNVKKVFQGIERREMVAKALNCLADQTSTRGDIEAATYYLKLSERLLSDETKAKAKKISPCWSICHICEKEKKVKRSKKTNELTCQKCYHEHEAPKMECIDCEKMKAVYEWTNDGTLCKNCSSDRKKITLEECTLCHRMKAVAVRDKEDGAICSSCYDKHIRPRPICSICGKKEIAKSHKDGIIVGKNCYQYKQRHGYYPERKVAK